MLYLLAVKGNNCIVFENLQASIGDLMDANALLFGDV
jgi:hypothetical protein